MTKYKPSTQGNRVSTCKSPDPGNYVMERKFKITTVWFLLILIGLNHSPLPRAIADKEQLFVGDRNFAPTFG